MTDKPITASRPRIIERWFPCAEVSEASVSGWGSSNSETLLMSWFAKRPLAQSRAAVLCSLLPWPEDLAEQERVQAVIREALGVCQDPDWYACHNEDCDDLDCTRKTHLSTRGDNDPHKHGIVDCARQDPSGGYDAARTDVLRLLRDAYPDRPAEMLDPFSGRGLIPIEAARYGQQAHAIDYSPVAALASRLLTDWPFRNWSDEPPLPFDPPEGAGKSLLDADPSDPQRLVHDIATVQTEVQRRIKTALDEFYPDNAKGEKPWGYLWAQVIPCEGCGREFPLYGSNVLSRPNPKKGFDGCSFELEVNDKSGTWSITVVERITSQEPTMHGRSDGKGGYRRGKLAWCPYTDCGRGHELAEHKRLVRAHYDRLEMLVVSDLDGRTKLFRQPSDADRNAADAATEQLAALSVNGLPARPDEEFLPASGVLIRAQVYGARNFGDLSVDRQNLLHATIAQAIADIATDIQKAGCSTDYAGALAGYTAAVIARKLKRSTRGATTGFNGQGGTTLSDIFINESSIAFNYDSFESGLGAGPGTWNSVSGVPSALSQLLATEGRAASVQRGSALRLPHRNGTLDAVVTDPPYQFMIAYSDVSDLYWVWLRRALAGVNFDFAMTAHPNGIQEKSEELIVKQGYEGDPDEHRTHDYYESEIAKAFAECRRVVHDDAVVTIVFGHGDPDAWRQLLDAITNAGLVLTGAWPANTEKGGAAGSANINTTLTLACRPAPTDRPTGRANDVDRELRTLIGERVRAVWEPSGLSYVDQKMAAAGPALEVVGRYSQVLDARGRPVDLARYLPLARQSVTDAHDLRFESLPLETFDRRTRFALEWVRTHGRRLQAKSEARWQRLAADMDEHETDGLLHEASSGVRFAYSTEATSGVEPGAARIDVAFAAAAAWRHGTFDDAAEVLRSGGLDANDAHFWAVVASLSKNLPETDKDGAVFTTMTRQRAGLVGAVESANHSDATLVRHAKADADQLEFADDDSNNLFSRETNR